jgi:SAM-dependent methyltransferase
MPKELLAQTRSHYDQYPFIEGGDQRIAWWRAYLQDYLPEDAIRDQLILDVGSSVGEISRSLGDRHARMVCVDISLESLRRCRELNSTAAVFHASALDLPFPDASFDHTISIGVLHHTPDCRRGFGEVARVTAPGGTSVIFLYNYWNIYNPLFQLFKPFKRLVPLDRVPVGIVRLLQPFARRHFGRTLDDVQLRRLLGDKLWTPQATFHSISEVRRWGLEENMRLTDHKAFFLGYANVFRFEKTGTPGSRGARTIRVACLSCRHEMTRGEHEGYRCPTCGRPYRSDGGIVRVLAD